MSRQALSITPSSTSTRVSDSTVENAVNALLKWRDSRSDDQKSQLLEDDEFVYLILTLKKIPPKSRTNAHKIPVPHSLYSETSELCLIIDDRPKSNFAKEAAVKKIKSENIPISKVIKFSKLKTNYRSFESKRKLCHSYDMFFSDNRVIPLLPRLLGKHFFKSKKIPVPVDLKHKNWKEQIDKVCGSALFYVGTGTCSVLRVGRVSMEKDEIMENVMAAINGVVEIVPQKWGNVRSFHLKLLESLALPVYQAVPEVKLKIEGLKYKEEENVTDSEGKEDQGKKKAKKGRIHEVRYMDNNIDANVDGDANMSNLEMMENDEMVVGEVEGKKKRSKEDRKDKKDGKKSKKMDRVDNEEAEEEKKDLQSAKAKKQKPKDKKGDGKKESKKIAKVDKQEGLEEKKVLMFAEMKNEVRKPKKSREDSSEKEKKMKKNSVKKLKSGELKDKQKKKSKVCC